jgi:hypothetical protein
VLHELSFIVDLIHEVHRSSAVSERHAIRDYVSDAVDFSEVKSDAASADISRVFA